MQSSFLWGYTFSSILGGVLADRYGGKRVMAWGVAVWSLATLLTPWAADHSTGMLLAARALFGLAEGVALPSMNTLLSRLDFKTLTTPSLFSILLYLLLSHYIISYLDRHTHTHSKWIYCFHGDAQVFFVPCFSSLIPWFSSSMGKHNMLSWCALYNHDWD